VIEDSATLGWVFDHGRHRRQVSRDAMFEVKDEMRLGLEIE
jgi:hypothetical protein